MEIFIVIFIVACVFGAIGSAQNKKSLKKEVKVEYRRGEKTEKQYIRDAEMLLSKHADLLRRCLEITERKVSVVDDYGEENWAAMPEEMNRLACKIAEREGLQVKNNAIISRRQQYSPTNEELETEKIYGTLGNIAAIRFKKFHDGIARQVSLDRETLSLMSGVEFESYVIKLLKQRGYQDIAGTPASGDQGADILAKKDGKSIVIQAKRYAKPVGNKAVQEVTAALRFYGGDEAWVVTNALFTPSARALAHKNNVRLVDGTTLAAQQL